MYIFLPRVVNENFNIFIIVFFEFFGTFLFAFFNFNLLNAKAEAKTETAKMLLFYIDFSLSLFMCVAYGRQFSGGVYNPAVTLFRMLRKTDRVTVKIGVIYMIAQFVGAALGSFIGT
jgi:glycerol uptake facilitator-like aquaporin